MWERQEFLHLEQKNMKDLKHSWIAITNNTVDGACVIRVLCNGMSLDVLMYWSQQDVYFMSFSVIFLLFQLYGGTECRNLRKMGYYVGKSSLISR